MSYIDKIIYDAIDEVDMAIYNINGYTLQNVESMYQPGYFNRIYKNSNANSEIEKLYAIKKYLLRFLTSEYKNMFDITSNKDIIKTSLEYSPSMDPDISFENIVTLINKYRLKHFIWNTKSEERVHPGYNITDDDEEFKTFLKELPDLLNKSDGKNKKKKSSKKKSSKKKKRSKY